MDHMDNFRERFEALEQQTEHLKHQTEHLKHQTHALEAHTHTVERRLRRWRGIAGGLLVLGLLSWALPSGKAADTQPRGMAERMATMEKKLTAMDFDDAANEVVISGANLRIVNGLNATNTTNGLGNLIVGYNESRAPTPDNRMGSHNVVIGQRHNFSRFGGLVVGDFNTISGDFASVSGGIGNTASGFASSVSGGLDNTASGVEASVSGGLNNRASGNLTSVSGGINNEASGIGASVSGGSINTASATQSAVSGGRSNTASGVNAAVSGGLNRTAPGEFNWAAGALFSDQ